MDTLTWLGRRFSVLGIVMLALQVLALPTMAGGEETRAGVVTKLVGTATVARAALPQPAPLHFKDDVLLQDRITTGESSAVRVLLGGKATITARERSVLTITEIPGTATVRLAAGRAAIAVVKDKMKPGEIIEIRTPNAVVAVRGTVVIAEVEPVVGGYRSTITILKGHVDVTKLDGAGRHTGSAVDVQMLERVIVTNAKPLAAAEKITRRDAESLAAQFSFVPQTGPTASTEALTAQVKAAAINDAIQAVGGTSGSTSNSTSNTTTASTTSGGTSTTSGGTSTTSGGTSTTTTVVGTVATPVTNTVSTVTTTLTNTVTTAVPTVTSTSLPVAAPVISPVVNTVTRTLTNVTSPAAPTVPSTGGLVSGLGR